MGERVRIGVIGAGSIGLRHCRSLAERVGDAELAAVADTNASALREAAALDEGVRTTTDYRDLLADGSVQAVVIATPNDMHAPLVQEAAEAGKHVFCEKPLGLDLASVDAALEAVARSGVKLQAGFQRRFDAPHREARRMIAAGEIGRVELVVAGTRDPAPPSSAYLEHSGSFFCDTAIHDFDAIRSLTGLEVEQVFAEGSSLVLERNGGAFLDTTVTSLRLENSAFAVVTNRRRTGYGCEVTMEVSGSEGKVHVGQEQRTMLRTYSSRGVLHDHVATTWERFEQAYVDELAHFTECIALDRAPEVSGADARAALAIALAAERSAREGRVVAVE